MFYKIISVCHTGADGDRWSPREDGLYPNRVGRVVEFDAEAHRNSLDPIVLNYVMDSDGGMYEGALITSRLVNYDSWDLDHVLIETEREIYELERCDVDDGE